MNRQMLANAVREAAKDIDASASRSDGDVAHIDAHDARDYSELLRCLARIIDGRAVGNAFGAPGDWGYSTAMGKALAARPAPGSEVPA